MYHADIIQTIRLIQIQIEKNHDDEHNKEINLIQVHCRICLYFKR